MPADGTLNAHTWDALLVTVRSNDTGDAVKAVQEELLNNGYEVFESPGIDAGTGVYDAGTEAVVKRFQTHFDLAVTGVVDAATWRTLAATGT
ncbi:peptidoglycan-binding domain-containing protein [Fodinicola feengrottensis]|uniref:peptidoglycan-binding domain-containing protein n=1 Tax=Fodinicola feengrottensis TaxID=435914 RepID=UPI0024415CF7|nr:peptidoglycan-binding domain-containing protein [Fodinicola feengrottensis]